MKEKLDINEMKNKVINGDCLHILQMSEDSTVDMVYLDPPFFTQKKQSSSDKKYEFSDNWDSLEEYLNYMELRLILCKKILKETGSIFLHCDKSASHNLRVILDKVFGANNFRSEIIWSYKRWSNSKKGLLNSHQVIFFYSKSSLYKFNTIFEKYSSTTNVDQILQDRMRNESGKTVYKRDLEGNTILSKEKKGVPMSDVWEIPFLNPKAKERIGYPTQKPILLLERIIEISTDENDVVLDPFCGSGTTLVASSLLRRNYIGIDIKDDAVELAKNRLITMIKTESHLLKKGRESYEEKTKEELKTLEDIGAIPVQRNVGIDGIINKNGDLFLIKIQTNKETLLEAYEKLIKSSKTKKYTKKILIRKNIDENENFSTDKDTVIIDSYAVQIAKHFSNED